jgi:tRNA A-37 threonylcarbamoyl transferase component Bud32
LSLSPGQAFGNYRILSRIGVGGMGMVFLAEHPHIGKRVALKIIHRDLAGNREVVNRFLNEARAVNQIGSEHIVEIHDFGQTDDGEHFFIMEFLDGRTLAHDLSERGLLDIPRSLHIAAQVASALAAAHDSGIIHRDLKPDNVMLIERLGDRDFVKLLDFGLAKFLVDSDARKLTAAGVVLGTPHYMSPEACESKADLDRRCDIYSLGVLLFQMLTGTLPFTGESMGEVLVKQVAQPPPAPRGINPNIPPAVEQILLRCLAKDPNMRFQSMRELREVLLDPAGYLASSPPVVPVAAAAADARTMYGSHAAMRRSMEHAAAEPPPADRPTEIELDPARAVAEWTAAQAQGQASPPLGAPTTYMDDAAHRAFGGPVHHVPQPVENRTMMIGTPHGYSNAPPRPRWLGAIVVGGIGAVIGVVAIIAAVSDDPPSPGPASSQPAPAPALKATGTVADAGPRLARIRLTTRPEGAEVTDAAGKPLGTTPTEVELPIDGREVVFRFRHPQAAESEKRFIPTSDAAFDIELPPPPAADAAPPRDDPPEAKSASDEPDKRRPRQRKKKSRNDVLRPEF